MRKCSGKILAAVLTGFALASAVSAGTLAARREIGLLWEM